MLADLLKSIIGPILGPLIDRIPDPNEKRRLQAEAEANLLSAITGVVMAQIEVNKEEAKHPHVFVAGWRPFVGWVCGAGVGWEFVVKPMVVWIAFLFGADLQNAPNLDTGELMGLITALLGVASLRTYEKNQGVSRQGWGKE